MIAYIGLGSNLGDRKENIDLALGLLSEKSRIVKVSTLIETEPVGCVDQGKFINGVVSIDTEFSPRELLEFCLGIEDKLGRIRTVKNGPRVIDLDILFYGDLVLNEGGLIVPHPRLHERGFVLKPLSEIAPELVHPVLKKKIIEIVRLINK